MLHFLSKSKLGLFIAGAVATKIAQSEVGSDIANKALDAFESLLSSKPAQAIRESKNKTNTKRAKKA